VTRKMAKSVIVFFQMSFSAWLVSSEKMKEMAGVAKNFQIHHFLSNIS
jgi:hypothetical protein